MLGTIQRHRCSPLHDCGLMEGGGICIYPKNIIYLPSPVHKGTNVERMQAVLQYNSDGYMTCGPCHGVSQVNVFKGYIAGV